MEGSTFPPVSPRQVVLADLLEMGVPIAWHEAVAIVRGLAVSVQQQAPPFALPRPAQILIDTHGTLTAAGADTLGHDPVPALRALLALLLDGRVAPPELVAVLEDYGGDIAPSTLQEFIAKLTFFARPDDAAELSALAARCLTYHESRMRDDALASLARRTRVGPTADTAAGHAGRSVISARLRRWLPLGLVVLGLMAGAVVWRLVPRAATPSVTLPAPAAELARRVQHEVASSWSALQQQLGLERPPDAPRGRDRALLVVRRRAAPSLPLAVAQRPGPHDSVAAGPGSVALTPGESPAAATLPPPLADVTVYSPENPGVVPPTLARPQMPAERIEGVSQERAGELELLVGVDGRVEQARLVPASNRFQDRMMISAAKTWRFAPATKDGYPVRFRVRIPITW